MVLEFISGIAEFIERLRESSSPTRISAEGFETVRKGGELYQKLLEKEDNVLIKWGEDNYAIANIEDLPQSERERIASEYQERKREEFRIVDVDFVGEIFEYEEDFLQVQGNLGEILPYLDSEYVSVLNLAKRVNEAYEADDMAKAGDLKFHVGMMYGKKGSKLVRLYTSGYVTAAIDHFVNLKENIRNDEDLEDLAQRLIDQLLKFEKQLYFVDREQGDTSERLAESVVKDMERGEKYIAIHSAGSGNVSIAAEAMEEEIEERAREEGYYIDPSAPKTQSSAPLSRFKLMKEEEREPIEEIDLGAGDQE